MYGWSISYGHRTLRDQVTYFAGFGYLVLYNLILAVPLIAVLWIAADKVLLAKVQDWKNKYERGAIMGGYCNDSRRNLNFLHLNQGNK